MWTLAVFPANEAREREDGLYDVIGVPWDHFECAAFPWEGTIRVVVFTRRSPDDPASRHTLRIYAGLSTGPAAEPMYSESIPGLPWHTRNGILVIAVPARMAHPGLFTLSAQIDGGAAVDNEFEMRLAG